MHILVDLFILAVIAFCGWQGYKRGILGSVIAVVFIIIALYGGNLLARTYSEEFQSMFRPFIGGYLDRIEEETAEQFLPAEFSMLSIEDLFAFEPDLEPTVVQEVFEGIGVYETRATRLTEQYLAMRAENDELSVSRALTNVAVAAFCFLIVFIIGFLLLLIALTVLYNLVHLSFRLPGIQRIDNIGGAVLGTVQGVMLVLVLAWAVGYLGLLLPESIPGRTWFLEFFVRHNPMVSFISL